MTEGEAGCGAAGAAGVVATGAVTAAGGGGGGFGVRVTIEAPPPAPQGCRLAGGLLNGQLYPIGFRFEASMAQKQVDGFVTARAAEGWFEWKKRAKVRNQNTLFMECRGL